MNGRIHSMETMGTVDGPGIRTVIFFQGCPMRCLYCHNPDTWDVQAGSLVEVDDLMRTIRRFQPYYASSSGGVTLSGGEPGMQPGFAAALLAACRREGIHTVLDTSGQMDEWAADRLLPLTDLVILDMKHMNPDRHRALTTQSLDKTLSFARRSNQLSVPLWIRQVLLPGWTDDPEQLRRLARFCRTLTNLQLLELLPYHRLGVHKWKAMGIPYTIESIAPPDSQALHDAVQILQQENSDLPISVHP